MRTAITLAVLFFSYQVTKPLTARDYYNEIYAARGLDRMADGHVCFNEDPKNENFFIFGQTKVLRQFLIDTGEFAKRPKEEQAWLSQDKLIVRGYAKGIPFDQEEIYDKDVNSWVDDIRKVDDKNLMRVRITVNWQTLRYKRAIEILNNDKTFQTELATWGQCEPVKTAIRQTANP